MRIQFRGNELKVFLQKGPEVFLQERGVELIDIVDGYIDLTIEVLNPGKVSDILTPIQRKYDLEEDH